MTTPNLCPMKTHCTDGKHKWTTEHFDNTIPKCPVCGELATLVQVEYRESQDARLTANHVVAICIFLGFFAGIVLCYLLDQKGMLK